jgi:hypothetical protein
MAEQAPTLFHEEQSLRQKRLLVLTAIPPITMTLLAIWQVGLGHRWGNQPMSNGNMIGWTIFLWLVYLRLITIKLVTDLRPNELSIAMRGLWRSFLIPLSSVKSVQVVTFRPLLDWGGYGIRKNKRGRAFTANGNRGVELQLSKGGIVLVGSQRPDELARALEQQR